MLNKYLQAGIGLTAALLTTPFLVQSAQADTAELTDGTDQESPICYELENGNTLQCSPLVDPVAVTDNYDDALPIGFPTTCANLADLECFPNGAIFDPPNLDIVNDPNLDCEYAGGFTGSGCLQVPVCLPGGFSPILGGNPTYLCPPITVIDLPDIAPTAVPEPLTLLGASAAIAFGAGFKRRKKQG